MEADLMCLPHRKMAGDIMKVFPKGIVITGDFGGDWKTGKFLKTKQAVSLVNMACSRCQISQQ